MSKFAQYFYQSVMVSTKKTKKKNRNKVESKASSATISGVRQESKMFMNSGNLRYIAGLLVLVFALFTTMSMVSFFFTGALDQSILEGGESARRISNWGGISGASLASCLINDCFGLASVFVPAFLILVSFRLMKIGRIRLWKWFANFSVLTILLSVALQFFVPDAVINRLFFIVGGKHGQFVCDWLILKLGKVGTFMALAVATIIYLLYLLDETVTFAKKLLVKFHIKKKDTGDAKAPGAVKLQETPDNGAGECDTEKGTATETAIENEFADNAANEPENGDEPERTDNETPDEAENAGAGETDETGETEDGEGEAFDPKLDLEFYKYPTTDLLKHYDTQNISVTEAEKRANEDRIRSTLGTFGVQISAITATVGPTVTLYEVTPAPGIRIAKIRNLEDDIARSLGAFGIRIIAPIPGKTTVGIEVPNKNAQIVSMESVINSGKFKDFKAELPVVLGKTITNEPFMFDLTKAPHLLVAGATGQGKSVGLNAIITSLLYRKHPSELKFVLIDPKKVELSLYSPLENHFLAKVPDNNDECVITDPDRVVYALNSLCKEMDSRYLLLKKARVRTIKEYNQRFCERKLNPEKGHRFLPYIVVVVDEFSDLIMTAGKNVETPIARIAQLARAVGIHMIIATQRPTTNIITGTIKANFPARIAFKVMQAVDSRTILDRTGANRLIGRGDMLYLAGDQLVRVQCAFVDTPEVDSITNYIATQQGYPAPFELPEVEMTDNASASSSFSSDEPVHLDPLFTEAAKAVVESGIGSTSFIQRRFSIGYNRAGRIMDQLEKAGIVGAQIGSKPREVLCTSQLDLDAKISSAF